MDNWEDWDNEEHCCLPNEEQLKVLEERKLVEESDNALTKTLFEDDLAYKEVDKHEHTIIVSTFTEKSAPKKNLISKQLANEQKQKEHSRLTKEHKAKKGREREIFGEASKNEYTQYEEMFY
jgi:hypothetical protein